MRMKMLKSAWGIVLICAFLAGLLYMNNDIGISRGGLEQDVRSSQKIPDDWNIDGDVSSTMAAFISYPQDKSDHTFSVYVNRPGISFGYFFRGGGDITAVEDFIAEFTVEGYQEQAFISMNTQNVERLEIDDGNTVRIIHIDSNKPFAIVLPLNLGTLCFYDESGNLVEYLRQCL